MLKDSDVWHLAPLQLASRVNSDPGHTLHLKTQDEEI